MELITGVGVGRLSGTCQGQLTALVWVEGHTSLAVFVTNAVSANKPPWSDISLYQAPLIVHKIEIGQYARGVDRPKR